MGDSEPPPGGGTSEGQVHNNADQTKLPSKAFPSYSSIAAINTSVRNKKNIFEVRLEKLEKSRFNLTQSEIEVLLKRLDIDSSQLIGVSACPEGKPVVLITLIDTVDLTKYMYLNESYIVNCQRWCKKYIHQT